ncbi:hypothetical protein DWV71_12715 [Clostridium sp. AF12-28]|nr:hypothetical protein [Clostridium sp. AF12-28]RHS22678.1 hypothetical protein DWV71_12715 [Clostridium sp. AF12-28]
MKKRGMKKRVLAALMTACMVVGSVPGVSLADATTDNSGISYTLDGVETTDSAQTAITLNKVAKPAGDGKYDITLTVDATKANDQIQVNPTEVAFVLDASGSMAWCTDETHDHGLSTSGKKCGKVDETNPSRWNVAIDTIESMSTELEDAGVTCHYIYFQGDKGAYQVDKAADYKTRVVPAGGTPISAGVKKGIEVLNAAPEGTNKILIIIADGGSTDTYMEHKGELNILSWPWSYYDNEKQILKDFKATGKSYTVSFALNKTDNGTSMNENKFKALANAGNLNAKNAEELKKVFETISKDITSGINDPLGENITMVSGTLNASDGSASYDENTNTIKWNSNGTMKDKLTLTYTVELTDEAKKKVGKIDLNGNAVFNYSYTKDGNKVDKQIVFRNPSITGATLTVNYVDENGTSVQDPVTEWVGFTGEKAFKTTIPQTNDEITIGTKSYRVTDVTSTDFAMLSLMVHPLKATEGKAYSVTVHLKKIETQPTIYKVTYDANGGAWNLSFLKDGYSLNATSGADKLTKENARGEETLEILSGNDLPTCENYDFDGWYLDDKKLTAGTTVANAAGTRTEVEVKAHWKEKKPEVPRKPVDTEIVPTVIVECRNASNSGHQARHYDVNDQDSYEIGDVSFDGEKYVSTVTVFGVYYAEKYNTDVDYAHVLTTVNDVKYKLTWNADTKKWEAPALTEIQTIQVDCTGDKPEVPRKPVDTEIVSAVIVECLNASKSGHEAKQYYVNIPNSYEIGDVSFDGEKYVSTVTVFGVYYAEKYNTDVDYAHVLTTVNDVKYKLTWNADTKKWEAPALTEIQTIQVDCAGDKPEVPRKPVDTEIVPTVIVECSNASKSGHEAKQYYVNIPNSYEIGDVSFDGEKYVSTVTVFGVYYAEKYNTDVDYAHVLTTVGDITYDLTWNAVTKKWEAPALTRIPTIEVDCSKDTPIPTDPELPGFSELEDLIDKVVLVHTGSNATAHPDEEYALMEDGYEVSWYGTTKAILTVKAAPYVSEYIAEHGNHDVKGAALAKLILARTDSGWVVKEGTTPIRFFVKCTENNPEKPALPKYDDLKDLFGETINVTCETDEQHAPQSFGLMAGTYSVTRDKEDDKEAVVTVFAKDYIKAYADGKHTNAGDDAATVKLIYDEDGKWYSENQEIVINFKAKCEKTPETPEKQYTEIKFVVVNGTFTENGQTELTKTFEVGTKLTLADIPASKGKSSSYSDQTWDKLPVGYVVGKDGTTFTITYKWRSSGSDSDDSDYDYGTSTRGKATNAAGKSGRWILEGGEFTEDNGRLPSNEYLKIGDTIYGFYTYGFAIDFDRPEYYTDAAIQAKGGYRDATGTWRLNGWWFCYDDGTFPHDEWVYLTWNGRSDWYYFDVDGWMEDGWLYRNNNWYYLHTQYDNTRGHMYTGWHEIDGKWYYFNTASDKGTLGAMLANTTTPDGYQVDANGAWIR